MKILFVDTGNIGRSQMAEAFLKSLVKNVQVSSAGTNVGEKEGDPVHELVIQVMKEKNIDMSKTVRKQLTESVLKDNDYIIGIFEEKKIPEILSSLPNFEIWNVDNPKNTSLEFHRTVRDQIEKKILELIKKV